MELEAMYEGLGITPAVQKFCTEIEAQLKERFEAIDETAERLVERAVAAVQYLQVQLLVGIDVISEIGRASCRERV